MHGEDIYAADLHAVHKQRTEILIDFTAGIAGGTAGVLTGHPLDTVKVRLQNKNSQYTSAINCLIRMIKEERITGLYKGMSSPLVGVAFINSLLFGVYGTALRRLGSTEGHPTLIQIFGAGMISGFVNAFFSCPIELVKIRLQNQKKVSTAYPYYQGPIDCCRQIYRKAGISGFYRGLGITIVRETPSYGAYFVSYEFLCRLMGDDSVGLLAAGGLAGIVGWLSTYPADVVKTRMQVVEQEVQPIYRNSWHCLQQIIRIEGSRRLFAGLGATAIRAFPTNAATFYAVALVKDALS